MKILVNEKLSPHRYKTPEGYLICTDAILARTGKQTYRKNEIFADSDDDSEIEVDRTADEVFSPATLASFENKPITVEHPEEDVNVHNYKEYAVGFTRDIRRGKTETGEDVILGNLVITDEDTIREIEEGKHTELSCGYDCDIEDEENPCQKNIRGNHVALCEQGRAGIARIVDSKIKDEKKYVVYADGTWKNYRALFAKHFGSPKYSSEADAEKFNEEDAKKKIGSNGKYTWIMKKVKDTIELVDSIKDDYEMDYIKTHKDAKEMFEELVNREDIEEDKAKRIVYKYFHKNIEDDDEYTVMKEMKEIKDKMKDVKIMRINSGKIKQGDVIDYKGKRLKVMNIIKASYLDKYHFDVKDLDTGANYGVEIPKNKDVDIIRDSVNDAKVMKFANNKEGKQFVLIENDDGTVIMKNSLGQYRSFPSIKKAEEELRSKGYTIFDELDEDLIEDDLIESGSEEAFKKNVATEIKSGKDPKQATAIAYSIKRKHDSKLEKIFKISKLL